MKYYFDIFYVLIINITNINNYSILVTHHLVDIRDTCITPYCKAIADGFQINWFYCYRM